MFNPINIPTPVAYDGPWTKYGHPRPTVLGLRAFMAKHRLYFERRPLTDRSALTASLEPIIDASPPAWRLFGTITIWSADPFGIINTDRRYSVDLTITAALDAAALLAKVRSEVAKATMADLAHLDAAITAPNPARSVTT